MKAKLLALSLSAMYALFLIGCKKRWFFNSKCKR